MKVFVDPNHHYHITNLNSVFRAIEISFFDEKCDIFIERYYYEDNDELIKIYPWKSFKTELGVEV